jgi:hypothetical protein
MKMCMTKDAIVIWVKALKKVFAYSINSLDGSHMTVPLGTEFYWHKEEKKVKPIVREVIDMICSQDQQSYQVLTQSKS